MESRFKYFVVGLFLIAFVSLFIVVVLVLYKGFYRVDYKTYLIKTSYSINGLEIGSPVKYKGVPVGKVKKIEVNWEKPSEVLVFVDIDSRLKVDEKIYATLGLQGITGLAYISLEESRKPLPSEKVGEYAVIPFKLSTFQEISDFIPNMLGEIHKLTQDLRNLINSLDVSTFNNVLRTTEKTLKDINRNIDTITQKLSQLSQNLSSLVSRGEKTLAHGEELLEELKNTTQSIGETSAVFKELAEEVRGKLPSLSEKFEKLSLRLEKTLANVNKLINKLSTNLSELFIMERTKPAPVER